MSFLSQIGIGAAAMAFLFLAMSAPGQFPTPRFPVGRVAAYPKLVQTGTFPWVEWSSDLPATIDPDAYLLFLNQVQLRSGEEISFEVGRTGGMDAPLSVVPLGARFELWAVRKSSLKLYLLDSTTVGPYIPMAGVIIRSEDPYPVLPRTRADRPFHVDVSILGMITDPTASEHLTSVTLSRHAQSYGAAGTGENTDRTQATMLSQSPITANGTLTTTYAVHADPEADPAKTRGEERFTVRSLADDLVPEQVVTSRFIQIWPVADGSIAGITPGQPVGEAVPEVTLHLNDLYPDSTTWAQVYKGGPLTGAVGTIVPGSGITVNDSIPADRVLSLKNYGTLFDSDGLWTMELLTRTPFGTDRLAHVSFNVQGFGLSLAEWRQHHFGSSDDSGGGADLNDFDNDGLQNLIEYAFGLDPKRSSAGLLPAMRREGNHLAISFTQPAGVSGIVYGAEWSTTLLADSWLPIANSAAPPDHLFSVSLDGRPRLYLRLKVTEE